jgi:hypothetical protein
VKQFAETIRRLSDEGDQHHVSGLATDCGRSSRPVQRNTVNQGEEPRDSDWGEFYMGEGHEKIKVSGLPDLPKPWNQYVLEAPVRGKVVEYLPDMMARVDIGRKDGLRAGMELVPAEEEFFSDQEIVTVEEAHATIKPKYPEGNYRAIRVGDLVSTRRAPRKRAQVR